MRAAGGHAGRDAVMPTHRWAGAPRRVAAVALVTAAVLAYGSVVHAVQLLTSGLHPYPGLPT